MFAVETLLVNLVLPRTNEGTLVDVAVDFNIGVIAQLKGVL